MSLLPEGSISLEKAAETQFSTICVDDPSNKVCQEEFFFDFILDSFGLKIIINVLIIIIILITI